jgi:hypothetical protein
MKDQVYFTQAEAEAQIGLQVEALAPFPAVPKGTQGRVIKTSHYMGDHYLVEVEWELSRPKQFVDLMVGDISFNIFRKRKPVRDEFCKSEFNELVYVVEPVE